MRGRRIVIGIGLVLAAFLLWGLAGAAESGSEGGPQLVHDFFPGEFDPDESLRQLTQLGNTLFFIAKDLESEARIWRTDGTPEGTRQVQVTGRPGEEGDRQSIVGRAGPFMLWALVPAEDPDKVVLLSSTEQGDGIPLHTYRPGGEDAVAIAGNRFYFQDCMAGGGCRVWSTDGTAAGTQPIRALAAQFPAETLTITGTFADRWLLFRSHQRLYAYDAATDRVLLLLPDYAKRASMFPAGDSLFFLTYHEAGQKYRQRLWVSRLDSPRAAQLFEDGLIEVAGLREGRLYFSSGSGRLWSTDGNLESTRSYSGYRWLPPASFSSLADQLGSINSRILVPVPGYYMGGLLTVDETRREVSLTRRFCRGKYPCLGFHMSALTVAGDQAFGAINGNLWQSDGTRAGTRAHEILSRVNVSSFRVLDGRLLVGGASREGEQQLWETDGTAAGTRALSDGTLDRPFRVEEAPVPLGGALLVSAERKPVGQQLWRVADGRTTPLTSLRHLGTGLDPFAVHPLGDRLVLGGYRGNNNWLGLSEGGTEGGPVEPLPIQTGGCDVIDGRCPDDPLVIGQRLLFNPGYSGEGLGFTDGTAAGSSILPLTDENSVSSGVAALGRLGDRALVADYTGGLWTSDGSASGTRFITRIPLDPDQLDGLSPVGPPVSLGSLAFLFNRVEVSSDPEDDAVLEVWRTDGTAAGTLRLASTPFPKDFAPYLHPVTVGGRLFFRFGGTLWVSDGSAAGTHPLQNQPPGGTFALAAGTDTLYAAAGYLDSDEEHETLWAIDPVTLAASPLGTFRRVAYGNVGGPLGSVLDNTLFFRAVDDRNVERWWVTEGTPGSTHPVPGLRVRNWDFFTAGNRRYFTSCDDEHGCELWSTDRLGEDTRRLTDLWPGPRGSDPQILFASETAVWFAATEPSVGREVWKIDLSVP